ncbi:MAG: DMT family transporter [Novosphingobium sp.]
MPHTANLPPQRTWQWRHFLALLAANAALALGPWWVRMADSGPVSAGFWRCFLPLPLLFAFARLSGQPVSGFPRRTLLIVLAAGLFFGVDIASWHIGIGMTRLGNATLFGNAGSLIVMIWGFVALRRRPHWPEALAILAAIAGAAILFGRSLEISTRTLAGDLFSLFAGVCYAFYLIPLQTARGTLGNWSLLAWSSLASALLLLAIALALGEPIWPSVWWPVIGLALSSQVLGQGLLVYSLKHFRPLVIGLMLLTQPVIGVLAGWLAFDEAVGGVDLLGMALVASALVIARASEKSTAT